MKRSSRGYGLLLPLEGEAEDERSRRTALSDWTNDSQDPNDPSTNGKSGDRIEIRNGYPVGFKCLDAAAASLTTTTTTTTDNNDYVVTSLQVPFDYELTMARNSASTFPENMRAFEWSVLWNVVEAIGLSKCDFTKQQTALVRKVDAATAVDENDNHRSRRRQRRRAQQQSDVVGLDSPPSYILSMTSDAEDEIDTKTVFCQFSGETDPSNVCVPMKGAMTIMFTGTQPEMMERFVLEEVQDVMGQGIVLVADIQSATYVGDRASRNREIVQRGADDGASQLRDVDNNNGSSFSSGIGLGISVCVGVVAASVLVLLVGLSLLRTKRLRRVRELEKSTRHELDAGGAFPDLEKQITTTSSASFEGHQNGAAVAFASVAVKNIALTESSEFIADSQPAIVEQDGILFVQSTPNNNNIQSVYLASKRQRKRKKGGGKKRKNSLRERVSMAPSGIEPIPEMDGDFESALCDKERYDASWSSGEEEDSNSNREGVISPTGFPFPTTSPHHLPNASPTAAPLIFFPETDADDAAATDGAVIRSIREMPKIRRLPPPWV
mmetsp:Transcript_30901/g.51063  ORF Transcript_30901/g.51063 Transcript_30901/m.51063 type:complete len:552 (-) Transcript_30901:194-1849(-)